jgi:16S rRNA (guanine527-N7)-methyltransferase
MNLTRHDTYEKFVARDVTDSLQLAKLLQPDEEILDVGTGGGVPGIPLAILRPDLQVSLCESVAKKAKAVDDIVKQLKLPIPVYHDRAENVLEDFRFTSLVVRAVAPLPKILRWFESHWASIGRLLLVKGPQWVNERAEARHLGLFANLSLRRRSSYVIPGSDAESVILEISPKTDGRDDSLA